MFDFFKNDLKERKLNHLYRTPTLANGLDFTSNDYLGLSSSDEVRHQMIEALKDGIPLSAKASRLLSGTHLLHEQMEENLKNFTKREGVLVFSSGYSANVGLLSLLAKNKIVFSDELNHASLIDGIRLSQSPYFIYPHNNLNALEDLLKKQEGEKLIITESLFSMEGDFSPLEDLSFLALKYRALLFVDEAHTSGLFGKNFAGRVSDLKEKNHIITLHTYGKALGSFGAFVASSSIIKEYLINNCRSFIYTTSLPPLLMVQWKVVLDILKKESFRPLELRKKSYRFRSDLSSSFELEKTESPIIPIKMNSTLLSLKAAHFLRERGFDIRAIRYPTVPKDKEGVRVILHYQNTEKQINQLKESLLDWKKISELEKNK